MLGLFFALEARTHAIDFLLCPVHVYFEIHIYFMDLSYLFPFMQLIHLGNQLTGRILIYSILRFFHFLDTLLSLRIAFTSRPGSNADIVLV